MNRIIKFRVWDKNHDRMLNWERLTSVRLRQRFMYLLVDKYERYDWIYMQFTGLFDKSGKEIYEGDILKFDDKLGEYEKDYKLRGIGIVEWNNYEVCFSLKWFNSIGTTCSPGLSGMLDKYDTIIGNKFQNHKLLEEK